MFLLLHLAGKSCQWEEQWNFKQPCAMGHPSWKKATTVKDVLVCL